MPKKKLKDRVAQIFNQLFVGLDDDVQEVKPLNLKEKLAQKRKAKEARQKVFSVLGLTVVFAILVGLPLGISTDPKLAVMASVAFPCFLLCFSYPRAALWIFLIYMPFSGTVTYSIGGGNALFQLSKDAFYVPALIALVLECRRRRLPILIPKNYCLLWAFCYLAVC